MISFLTGSIPNFEFDSNIFQTYSLRKESCSNSWFLIILRNKKAWFLNQNSQNLPGSGLWQIVKLKMIYQQPLHPIIPIWIEEFSLNILISMRHIILVISTNILQTKLKWPSDVLPCDESYNFTKNGIRMEVPVITLEAFSDSY